MIPESLKKHVERASRDEQATHAGESWNPMLSLALKDGSYVGLGYGRLIWVNFNPSVGLLLHFGTHTVRIKGRNLTPLYREVMLLRTKEIAVVEERYDLDGGDRPVVTDLEVVENTNSGADV
jgi:hypothetical protein